MGKLMLVVDDNPDHSSALYKGFRARGFEVVVAPDAVQALVCARRARPDIVLLDYSMPAGSGGDVYHRLRAVPELQGVPIVFITGSPDHQELERIAETDYRTRLFTKPVLLRDLAPVVESLCRSPGSR
ncbi:MAG: response regulator [Elusimicrobia bacterium]|nr:response regulator [Elusimicrobiota bacterium]